MFHSDRELGNLLSTQGLKKMLGRWLGLIYHMTVIYKGCICDVEEELYIRSFSLRRIFGVHSYVFVSIEIRRM